MKIALGIIGSILMFLAIAGGILTGVGTFAYGIYTIVLLIKGTLVATFWSIFKVILCWVAAPVVGWLWFFIFGFIGGVFLAAAAD